MKNHLLKVRALHKLFLISFGLVLSISLFIECKFIVRFLFSNINFQNTYAKIFSENFSRPIFGLKPNISGESFRPVIETDNHGFKKIKHSFDPKKSSWLLQDDSFTLGMGVEAAPIPECNSGYYLSQALVFPRKALFCYISIGLIKEYL